MRNHPSCVDFRKKWRGTGLADSKFARMRRTKVFAQRFSGFEFWHPGRSRYELRLMPQPVLRYQAPGEAVVDGAVFILSHDTEPELVLMIRAVETEGKAVWQYGAIAIGSAEFHAQLNGQEVYARAKNNRGLPTESYYLITNRRSK